jgi:hypothetical protein
MDLIAAAQGPSEAILRLKACYLVLSFHAKGSMEEPHPSFPSTAPLDYVNAVIMLVDPACAVM